MIRLFLAIPFVLLAGCGGGIEPVVNTSGFSGKVVFVGNWPDSITRTHLVIFEDPLNSADDFSLRNLKYISVGIPYGITEFQFSSQDSSVIPGNRLFSPGEYSYVAVAQSGTPDVSLNRGDWYVVGVFYAHGDTTNPGKLIIPENTFVENVNLICDFNNPPPQPPGGN
jgi:hypothetical protein